MKTLSPHSPHSARSAHSAHSAPSPRRGALSTLTASLALALPTSLALAQAVPDAGQTLRELQRPAPAQAPATATLSLPAETDLAPDNGQRFAVKAIRIEGATLFPAAELQPLVDALAGTSATLGELRLAARRVTAYYRERGFPLARAYLPAQTIDGGVVTVQVLEGLLGKASVANGSGLPTPLLERIAAAQNTTGAAVQGANTDRALLLIADLPGAGAVSGSLRPGQAVGTSDLVVKVAPGKPVEGDIGADNHGNRYTGEARVNGRLAINNPFGLADRVELRATASNEKLAYGRAAYDAPLGADGLRGGVALSTSRYQLAREFASLDATGTARNASLFASYPVLRGLERNVWLSASAERRLLKDDVRSTTTQTRKSANVAGLDVYGDAQDALGGGGINSWRLGVVAGALQIDTPAALAADQQGPRTDGSYRKLQASVARQQTLAPTLSLAVSLAGQYASKNLDSSEKFVLGGAYGVRAYPQGEGTGDQGLLANVELRHDVLPGLQAAAFFDAGHVRVSHNAYAAGAASQTLRGYGVSAMGGWGPASVKLSVAWRDGNAAVTAPDRQPRLWLQAGWRF